jgi:hypothetical protein
MPREWSLDRKNRQEKAPPLSKQKNANVNIVSYVESHRKKLKSTHSLNRVKTNLRLARAHLKTLTSRAKHRERLQTQEKIRELENRVEEMSSGVFREMSEFDSIVQPYLDVVQEIESETSSMVTPRAKVFASNSSSSSLRKPKSSFKGDEQSYDKSSLQDELAMVLDNAMPPVLVMKEDMCDTCDVAMVVMTSEARMGCPMCSRTKPYMQATSSRIPYGEEVEFASFSYKRQNHFQEWLNAIQAKENTEVSNKVINDVISHIYHKNGIRDTNQITQTMVRTALKALDLRKQYDHTMQIFVSITGKKPPRFSAFQEEQLRLMFDAIQGPFKKHCPPDRKNFLSYSYCLHKFCELLGYDNFLQYFMLLKGVEKLRKQDAIFSNICEELDWQFIPSYKEREATTGKSLEEFVKNAS